MCKVSAETQSDMPQDLGPELVEVNKECRYGRRKFSCHNSGMLSTKCLRVPAKELGQEFLGVVS